jgi:diguanylate cyclase (GGDEF)-like protein
MLYNIELQQQAGTDPLTTLYNRRRMEEVLKNHIRANPNENFSIAIGDIDFFKKINDTYGHNCGDQVLKSLSDLFREKTLGAGHVCRWGGEEFLFFFPKMNLDNAAVLMNEINIAVSKCIISYKDITIHVTMTFGVEENDFQSSISDIVKRADDKLYYGKTHGRDTVIS